MKTKIIQNIKSIILALILVLGVGYVYAQSVWTPPTAPPPGDNTAAPINVGSSGQSKSGGLILNTGGAANGLIVVSGNVGIGTTNPSGTRLLVRSGDDVATTNIGIFQSLTDSNGAVVIRQDSTNDWGIIQSSGSNSGLQLRYNTAGTEAAGLTLISTGNVGIGTTSPGTNLEVYANAGTPSVLRLSNGAANGEGGRLEWWSGYSGGKVSGKMWSGASGTNGGDFHLQLLDQTSASLTERVTILNNGNVGIGTTNPSTDKLVVVGDIRVGTSGTNGCVEQFAGTALVGTCSSDIRLKKNVESITGVLDKFIQLQPVTYQWRGDEFPERHFGNEPVRGLIAQDVEKIFPDMVGMDSRGFKTMDYGIGLQMLSIQAIKELNLKVTDQQAKIDKLSQGNNGALGLVLDGLKALGVEIKQDMVKLVNLTADVISSRQIYTKTIDTEELCVSNASGKTCITRAELDALLQKNGISNSNTGSIVNNTGTPTPAPAATPTANVSAPEQPATSAAVSPAPAPDVTPTPVPIPPPTQTPTATNTTTAPVTPAPTTP